MTEQPSQDTGNALNYIIHMIWGVIVLLVAIVILQVRIHQDNVRKIDRVEDKIDVLYNAITERTYKDSIMIDHVKKCSFIERDDIKVDKRGYFYSSYARYYK